MLFLLWVLPFLAVLMVAVGYIIAHGRGVVEINSHTMRRNTRSPHVKARIQSQKYEDYMENVKVEFDVFLEWAKQHGIKYHLAAGNLLGVVRAGDLSKPRAVGDFIPWDDDVDVMIAPESLDTIVQLYGKSLQVNGNEWYPGVEGDVQLHYNPHLCLFKIFAFEGSNGLDLFPFLDDMPYNVASAWRHGVDQHEKAFHGKAGRPLTFSGRDTFMPQAPEGDLREYCRKRYSETWHQCKHPSL